MMLSQELLKWRHFGDINRSLYQQTVIWLWSQSLTWQLPAACCCHAGLSALIGGSCPHPQHSCLAQVRSLVYTVIHSTDKILWGQKKPHDSPMATPWMPAQLSSVISSLYPTEPPIKTLLLAMSFWWQGDREIPASKSCFHRSCFWSLVFFMNIYYTQNQAGHR